MKKMHYVLSAYPLSTGYKEDLEQSLGTKPSYLMLSELRSLPFFSMVKKLRSLGAETVFIPLEDINSSAILPILEGVAAASDAGTIEVVYPDLVRKRVRRRQVALRLCSLINASLAGLATARTTRNELDKLLTEPLITENRSRSSRVLYLNANLWFGVKAGGSIGHVAGVVNGLLEKGYEVLYASAGERTMIDPRALYSKLAPPNTFGFPFELNYYRFHRSVVDQAEKIAGAADLAFLYQRMSIANYSGVVLSRRMGIPLVLEYNGSEAWIAKNWGRPLRYHDLAVKVEDTNLRHAHVVVTISDVLRDELIDRGVSAERIVTYPNCIDPAIFDPAAYDQDARLRLRRTYGIAPDATVITFVGTFGQWHGVEMLARAVRNLAENHRDWIERKRLHFLIIGDGLKMPLVREILAPDYCKPYYTLTGLVLQKEAPLHLAASDIFLSPHVSNADGTKFFGSPTKLFEYMAMGKGIVASDLYQIGEILRNSLSTECLPITAPAADESRLAVLFRPDDLNGLIQGIRFLVDHPEWGTALGRNARQEALSRYTWSHHVNAILERLTGLGLIKRI